MNNVLSLTAQPRPWGGRKLILTTLGIVFIIALSLLLVLIGQLLAPRLWPPVTAEEVVQLPLGLRLLQERAILISSGLSLLILVGALVVGIAPLTWWLRLLAKTARHPNQALIETVAWVQAHQGKPQAQATRSNDLLALDAQAFALPPGTVLDATGAPISQATGQPAAGTPTAGTPPAPPPGAQPPGAPPAAPPQPGTPPPGAPPGAPPAAGAQPVAAAGTPPSAQPPAAQPPPAPAAQPPAAQPQAAQPQSVSTLQQALTPPEGLSLQEITNVNDILSSAFNDDEEVDAQLLTLSQSVADVALEELVDQCRTLHERLLLVAD